MTTALIAALCLGSAVFDVHSFRLESPDAIVFLARVDADRRADIAVAEAGRLTFYPASSSYTPVVIPLAEGASAFDVADVDGDGRSEVIALCGDRIVQCAIPKGGAAPAARTLFEMHTLYSGPRSVPIPVVLAVPRAGQTVLALPCETTLELKSLAGVTVASFPTGPDAPRRVSFGHPFETWTHTPSELGPATSLDTEVSRILDYEPDLPSDLAPAETGPPAYRRGTPAQARGAAAEDAAAWPWFPLTNVVENAPRVLYAASDSGDTLIRLTSTSSTPGPQGAGTIGPVRRYPGLPVVLENALPDFNGDGNTDLALWKSPLPGASLDALAQAATAASWPIRITIHLFSPEKSTFDSRPLARIDYRVPVQWFLNTEDGMPIHNVVLRDFDGDGKTDFAFSSDDRTLVVWTSRQGFRGEPAQVISFPEPIRGVEFQNDVDGAGCVSLGIRTARGVHFLHGIKP